MASPASALSVASVGVTRYTSATPDGPRRDARRDRRRLGRRAVRADPGRCGSAAPLDAAGRAERGRGLRAPGGARRAQRRRRRAGLLPRRRDVRPLRAGDRRRDHPALRVPHPVHALPAGDLPGRPAGDVRVPDRDVGADRRCRSPTPALYEGPSSVASAGYLAIGATKGGGASSSPAACTRTAARRSRPTPSASAPRWSRSGSRAASTDAAALAEAVDGETAAVFLQSPNFLGAVEDVEALGAAAKEHGALLVVAVDPMTLGVLRAAGRVRRRHRPRRGPAARQPARLRRPLVRLLLRDRGADPPHAGPDRRRDRRTSTAAAASSSRCRPASSTSAARRRPTTSAPRRR